MRTKSYKNLNSREYHSVMVVSGDSLLYVILNKAETTCTNDEKFLSVLKVIRFM